MLMTKRTPKDTPKKRTKSPKKTEPKTGRKMGVLVPQPHGGALLNGMAANHVPGPGRPKDEVREKLLGLANGKGFDFLDQLMDGKVDVKLIGVCPKCGERSATSMDDMKALAEQIRTSVDQRLKGLDLSLRYGAGTKDELDVASHPDAQRFANAYKQALEEAVTPQVFTKIMGRVQLLLGDGS
jgi:hypothetical protein